MEHTQLVVWSFSGVEPTDIYIQFISESNLVYALRSALHKLRILRPSSKETHSMATEDESERTFEQAMNYLKVHESKTHEFVESKIKQVEGGLDMLPEIKRYLRDNAFQLKEERSRGITKNLDGLRWILRKTAQNLVDVAHGTFDTSNHQMRRIRMCRRGIKRRKRWRRRSKGRP